MIRKRKNKRSNGKTTTFYQAVVYFKGEVVSRKSFDTKAQAVLYESRVLKKCKLGQQGIYDGYTFGMCVEDYLKSDFKLMEKSSQKTRLPRIPYLVESPLAKCLMEEFNDRKIDEWFDWLYKHKTVTKKNRKSFKAELVTLSIILAWYKENKDSTFTPPILKRHRKKCYFKPITERIPNYYIAPEDVCLWLDHLKNNSRDIVYYRLALFMILTGCRVGEATGLCWDAVHLNTERPFVQIIRSLDSNAAYGEDRLKERVKTKSSVRIINLPPILVKELKNIDIVDINGKSPVFYSKKSNFLGMTSIIRNFNKAFEALNLPWRGSHIARHTSGTIALIAGKDLAVVQAMLGHRDIKQTQEYAKVIALQNNSAPQKTAEYLGLV